MADQNVAERVAERLKAEKLDRFSDKEVLELINAVTAAIEGRTPATRKAVAQFASQRVIALGASLEGGDDATRIANLIEEELARPS